MQVQVDQRADSRVVKAVRHLRSLKYRSSLKFALETKT